MASFPFDVWGVVDVSASVGDVTGVKVVRASGGGYLLLTIEHGSEYDTWLETLDEVEEDLRRYDVQWAADPTPAR